MDEKTLKDLWGVLAVRGIFTLLFGFAAVFWPGLTVTTLVYLFGGFLLINGIISLIMGLVNMFREGAFFSRLLTIVIGLVEIGLGVYLLRHPLVSLKTLILLIGLVLIVRGVLDGVSALFEKSGAMNKTIMLLEGLLAIVVGVIMLFQPVASGVAFVWVLGLYALITGPLLIALAFEAKNSAEAAAKR